MRGITRRSAILLGGFVLAGFVLRIWNIGDLGLTHFDEGSYALSGEWIASGGAFGHPLEAGHSPPLYPFLVAAGFFLFGFSDAVAIGVSALAGAATVGLVYWIGYRWFGEKAGVAAALLLLLSEYHLVYSRMALTDATFTFFFWLAVALIVRSLTTPSVGGAILAGIATGLCWNVKYDGFLPLVAASAWLLVWSVRAEEGMLSSLRRLIPPYLLACLTAAVLYLPWVVYVQRTVGYASVLEGQLDHVGRLAPFSTGTPMVLAYYLSHWVAPPVLVLGGIGFWFGVRRRNPMGLMVAVILIVLPAACSFYFAFPRLLLPLIPAVCLSAGWALESVVWRVHRPWRPAVWGSVLVLVLIWSAARSAPILELKTDGYRQACRLLCRPRVTVISQMSKCAYFYLSRCEVSAEMRHTPTGELDRLIRTSLDIRFAIDPIIHRLSEEQKWFNDLRPRLVLVDRVPLKFFAPVYFQGIDPRVLDRLPLSVAPFRPGQDWVEIYRLREPEAPHQAVVSKGD